MGYIDVDNIQNSKGVYARMNTHCLGGVHRNGYMYNKQYTIEEVMEGLILIVSGVLVQC